jgi:hypothetical protein
VRHEDVTLKELNAVLLQFHRMQDGFAKARLGLEDAVKKGRVAAPAAERTEHRLRSGSEAYHRAGYRLTAMCDRLWREQSRVAR